MDIYCKKTDILLQYIKINYPICPLQTFYIIYQI